MNKPLSVQQMYDLLEVADPTESLQSDPYGEWEIVEFVRQIEKHYSIERTGNLYQEWQEWRKK
jgi:predicted metalloenzyme YecM